MSYLVLARKWRPKRFDELVGQEHVVRALTNALETGKVHHAFLFTGTRGVGKTTIARIFAKSLNCERGAGAEPCGECAACLDIDAGRFVDLLEIDAASHTGVDDVRSLIENAQYMPARGRTKVYLIDEVHMLSRNAFNALLKTLEEPPGHVKFLLATTDPQKLPATVLSRCLQFNLRRLEPAQISGQMSRILAAEGIDAEPAALALLARAADGSLRDGLSLLDQAIAHTGGKLDEADVNAMLGTVERARVGMLLDALCSGDGAAMMEEVEQMAQYAPDFGSVLEDLAVELHRVQLHQLVPGYVNEDSRIDAAAIGRAVSAELVQLWYQMAVNGRRDLGMAPSPRAGFEMTLLRMLAFRPTDAAKLATPATATVPAVRSTPAAAKVTAANPGLRAAAIPDVSPPAAVLPVAADASPLATPLPKTSPPVPPAALTAPAHPGAPLPLTGSDDWLALIRSSSLKGPAMQLAAHAVYCGYDDGLLRLFVPAEDVHLRTDNLVRQLAAAVSAAVARDVQIRFDAAAVATGDTLQQLNDRQRGERQAAAEADFLANPIVGQLLATGAAVLPDSIRPPKEN